MLLTASKNMKTRPANVVALSTSNDLQTKDSHWPHLHTLSPNHTASKLSKTWLQYPNESKFQRLEAWFYKRIGIGGLQIEWKSRSIWIHPKKIPLKSFSMGNCLDFEKSLKSLL